MNDLHDFINCRHSLLIAPAGFGKTYTIASCLNLIIGKHLVLTHTNAGIASIFEKIKALKVPSSAYQIETISSFAQNIALSFTDNSLFPPQESGKQYYKAIIERATVLIKLKPIRKMLGNSFSGLFVDEYQDCTLSQHRLIQQLAEIFPTHLLGDPLQGIFNLDAEDPLVNLNDTELMNDFLKHKYKLETPWRWNNQNNKELADDLKRIRKELETNETPIRDFSPYKNIVCYQIDRSELFYDNKVKINPEFRKKINDLLYSEENVLFIHSNSANRKSRIEYVKAFSGKMYLIESIDDENFYQLAKTVDLFSKNDRGSLHNIYHLLIELFPKTEIEKWLQENRLTRKGKGENEGKSKNLRELFDFYKEKQELIFLAQILETIRILIGKHSNCRDLYFSLLHAIKRSHENSTSVYDEMVNQRNIARRVGRKLFGKSIGTTLLTKGLECDTVVLLEEKPFEYKNQYVALTRGSKKVFVFQIKKNDKIKSKKKVNKNATANGIIQLSMWD
ncbi:MAG TPA: hypothetical protein DGC94_15725 [Prolixibacteraceae bacterium]|nr:hypothetical protein [Prolixibacteraceae bacterium]